jgi:hypothetical protein
MLIADHLKETYSFKGPYTLLLVPYYILIELDSSVVSAIAEAKQRS